ncbi:hypothetical protein EDC56_1569 [Sinobacterium caligoides]|uniref:LPP20 lipoprotein n=2 Tax=Sinobacterium caligoides TaxID=933926 RepID=A0A3N2DMV2_9GAMM|nr:hypothetical protein EDC56_1569 [Sinobacterium caligoides]
MNKMFLRLVASAAVAMFLVACSSETKIDSDLYIKGAPDWVNEGTQAISSDDGRLIHGVGMSAQVGDESLQKSVADNRARAEVARILSTSVDAQSGDYTSASGGVANSLVNREINTQTQLALKGVKIIGRWRNRDTGDIYSAAEMDLDQLEDAIKRAANLSEGVKAQFIKDANLQFDRFVKENK